MRVVAAVVLLAIGCADDPEPPSADEVVISKVLQRDYPIVVGQMLSLPSPCFEVEIPQPFDCSVSLVNKAEPDEPDEIVPSCESSPDARPCWRIVVDPLSCFDGAQQSFELVHREAVTDGHNALIECVTL